MVIKQQREYDRKPLVRELCETKEEVCDGVVHAIVRGKGLLVFCYGVIYSYLIEFFEWRSDTDGNYYMREIGSDTWELVYDCTLNMFFPFHGLCEENRRTICFKGEFLYLTRSIALGKHVIMLALFEEGVNVLKALGKQRVAMIRRVDRDKDNHALDNLYLHVFYKYRRSVRIV